MCTEHTMHWLLRILSAHETKKLATSLSSPTSGLQLQSVTFLSLLRKLLNASHARTC